MGDKIKLGYWSVPGKAMPSRYLLELSGAQYEEVRYTNSDDWFTRDKYSLGLDFPNLPYLIDGNVKLTESETIFDYLIQRLNKTELLGKDADKYTVDTLRNLLPDIFSRLYQYQQMPQGEAKTKTLEDQILPKIRDVHKFLGQKEFLLGYFTAADLYFLNLLRKLKDFYPEVYKLFKDTFEPALNRLEQIPQIASYIQSGRHP